MSEYPTPCVGYSDSRREKFVVSAKPNGYSYGRIELYSSAIAASISNQAERAQAQGQFMGELTRAGTAYDVGKLNALANRIRGITGIEGNRISSVGGIYGGLVRAAGAWFQLCVE